MRATLVSSAGRAGRLGAMVALLALAGCVVAPPRHHPGYAPGRYAPPPAPVAEPMYFYPERGQPEGLQDRDRYECYRLAVRDSGVDPGMTPFVTQRLPYPPPVRRDGAEVIGSAAAGAVIGAAVSSPRHAGEHAVIGAIFGALLGAASQEARAQAAEAAYARRAEAIERARAPFESFRRAMSACMQARGYRVG